MDRIDFTEMHLHTGYSLKDGMIRISDYKDPKHVKSDIILHAEYRNTGTVTATDHGNMYGQAELARMAKQFGLKHIPGCEFYMAVGPRSTKSFAKGEQSSRHICIWAKSKEGYANMCRLQKLSYTEGFYRVPRIDKEILDKYGSDLIVSDACVGGVISNLIVNDRIDEAHKEFIWYLDRFKNDFYIEYQNHHMEIEDKVNKVKVEWANAHGVPIIATTDAHYYKKEDRDAHKTLLSIQYARWVDDPTFTGFGGDGYYLMNDDELLERFPVEYLNNTRYIVDKVDDNIMEFGNVTPPSFKVPEWFVKEMSK